MLATYLLKIETTNLIAVEEVMGAASSAPRDQPWTAIIDSNQTHKGKSPIEHLLMMIEGKTTDLSALIDDINEAISLWVLYEYEEQCNLEFTVHELTTLAINKVSLCISCWQI